MKSGTIFDNILITDDPEKAKKEGEEVWKKTSEGEKKMKEKQDEEQRKKEEEEEKKRKEEEEANKKEEEAKKKEEEAKKSEEKKEVRQLFDFQNIFFKIHVCILFNSNCCNYSYGFSPLPFQEEKKEDAKPEKTEKKEDHDEL